MMTVGELKNLLAPLDDSLRAVLIDPRTSEVADIRGVHSNDNPQFKEVPDGAVAISEYNSQGNY